MIDASLSRLVKDPITRKVLKEYREGLDYKSIKSSFARHLKYSMAKDEYSATELDKLFSLALSVRDRLIEKLIKTQQTYYEVSDTKRIYYLSLEFLIGRMLINNMINLRIDKEVRKAMDDLGIDIDKLAELEEDPGLGNGGLGRLAACFLDSLATLEYPAYGYGIRYEFGIFKQVFQNGYQVEKPEEWLKFGNPWEFERPEYSVTVKFYGRVNSYVKNGELKFEWVDTRDVLAVPYDTPIVGYDTNTVNTLRLWAARASEEFDLQIFNHGDYVKAVENKNLSEVISKVLYPNDNIYEGKELRLKQEYFFVSASLQDIIRRFKKQFGNNFELFPDKVAIQLNDTHPALAIPELMRILVDIEEIPWDKAWDITVNTFGYTNHTVMPEALEKWEVSLFERLFPRHLQIINEINRRFLNKVSATFNDINKIRNVSIFEEGPSKMVRMANLCVIGSHSVNGVSELHTNILKNSVMKDFYEIFPDKFNNKTNGVTQRRWLLLSNPGLASLITETIGDKWVKDLYELRKLEKFADDRAFLDKFYSVKQNNKEKLARYIKDVCGVKVDPVSMYDVQVKRLHEYKRQLLNAMHIIYLYTRLKDDPNLDIYPRTFIFGAKAAPGYYMAKLIIKLINSIGETINRDKSIKDKIKVVFIPNYNVSLAEKIIPAANVSEQISTAGKEASGTGNMKFALNGAITIGTLDGANVEIMEEVGEENIFIFGLKAEEVAELRMSGRYSPYDIYNSNPDIKRILDMIIGSYFAPKEPGIFEPIYNSLLFGRGGSAPDEYFLLADFEDYKNTHAKIDALYRDKYEWNRKALLNTARMGKFSSDRTIKEYCEEIWKAKPVKVRID
ncbi:MAG: glycogen/starch/alpha-glucan phosphorylase [Spirochaetia bacterium]|nr:glycogen/starch/alpha-glucan phosphorylase [Spirochaetota bacterium]MCX8097219.1 glycogen/starch/alpha-glucan phosphorylase [Spirochaetota bacterium]MDW8111973.1 glycogen/starch/alpha-glucan phosphorylase [Spirochaetia bacterium]